MNSTWLIAFIFLAVLPISISQPPATSLDKPDPDATSLVPSNRHDTLLVATLDGTISLIEISSQRILWSFKSGRPIYSSYQAPVNLDASQNASEPRDDSYIDCGEDWHLYKHDRAKGTVERLNCTCGEFITIARNLSTDGTTLLVQQTTTYFVVDAKTGTVMRIMSPSDPPGLGFEGGGNPVMVWDESKEQLYITRTDYMFSARTKLSGKLLWKLTFAEIEAEFSCQEVESSTVDNASHSLNQLLSDYKSDFGSSSYCQRHTTVYRIRDHSYSEIMSETRLVDGVPKSLTGDRLLPLPAADPSYVPMLVGGNHGAHYDDKGGEIRVHSEKMLALSSVENNDPVSHTEVLALPFPEVSSDVTRQNSNLTFPYHVWLPVVFVFFFLFMVGFIIRRCFLMVPQNKQMEDSTSKVAIAKKKRTRKSGINRNNTSANNIKGITLNGNNDGGAVGVLDCESIDKKLHLTFTGLLDTQMDGRRIGKLFVSSNEIAKGSNGTVVLEGVYDGRPVAVKRLVQTHTDVARKEIQNLIASDQHPNIVRLYGAEFDSDFVYLSLERCMCSLNDMIHFYAESSHIEGRAQKMDFNPMNEYILQLHGKVGGKIDFELWKADGYPSSPLLKLMRDVVSGLAHLHELGIIHRDLKPQNVLIIKEKSLCAKLSDMGISKRLVGDMSALTQHATGGGSSGWRAPEQLLHGRQTRAVDLFSLGCVLFFCISGGKHPFGDCFERDSNIVKNQKDLFLVDHIAEAVDLISHLLDPDPQLRPKASEALLHPLFWNSETRLSFLRDVSDRVELEDREVDSDLLKALEATAPVALGGKWDEKLENSFLTNIGRYRRYKYDSVRDLLRVIRNKLNHYRELPKDIQEVLGSVPEGFDYYFMSRFPKLLIEVYRVIEKYCREEELLSKYFKSSLI